MGSTQKTTDEYSCGFVLTRTTRSSWTVNHPVGQSWKRRTSRSSLSQHKTPLLLYYKCFSFKLREMCSPVHLIVASSFTYFYAAHVQNSTTTTANNPGCDGCALSGHARCSVINTRETTVGSVTTARCTTYSGRLAGDRPVSCCWTLSRQERFKK
jgi:hypothetical protein